MIEIRGIRMVSMGVYTRTQPNECSFRVFTFGPSPATVTPLFNLYQFNHGQISPSTVGVYISTQPSCYLQHHQCGDADQERESFESESLAMVAIYISCNLM